MILKEILHELRIIRKELQIIRNEKEFHPEIVLDERTISQAVRKLERNIEIKTEGLADEENKEIHDFIRRLSRKNRIKSGKNISYKLKMGEKKYATR